MPSSICMTAELLVNLVLLNVLTLTFRLQHSISRPYVLSPISVFLYVCMF